MQDPSRPDPGAASQHPQKQQPPNPPGGANPPDQGWVPTVSCAQPVNLVGANPSAAEWALCGQRYQISGEIARGGMGAVLRGIDTDLQRPLAIKVMLRKGDAAQEARFLDEARITGQLQHPGIPPVHEVGRMADGRPFFAMKLIEGRTLAALLEERPSPQGDLPRFLKIFEQIAETLAYAHSQGVIHRDLKPANVMVGAFGEVQVMDWGLARRLRGGEPSAGTSLAPASEANAPAKTPASPDVLELAATAEIPSPLEETWAAEPTPQSPSDEARLTRAGTILGTPPYMPPEQARGQIELLDERSDVFGLGAILCEILTGSPPYVAPSQSEVLRLAQRADLADAHRRLTACGADVELIAVTARSLAPAPEARYTAASAMAEALSDYSAGVQERLRQSELRVARGEVKAAEEQKRRRMQLLVVGSLAALLAVSGIGGWWVREQSVRKQERARLTVEAALPQLAELERRALWEQGAALLDQVEDQVGPEADPALREQLSVARENLNLLTRLDRIRQDKSTVVGFRKLLGAGANPRYAEAFREYGFDLLEGDVDDLCRRVSESPVRDELVATLDDWASDAEPDQQRRLDLIMATVTGVEWRRELSQLAADSEGLRRRTEEVIRTGVSPGLAIRLADLLEKSGQDGLLLLEAACRWHAGDFWLHLRRGWVYWHSRRYDRAIGAFQAALVLQPRSPVVRTELGNLLVEAKDFEGSIAWYKQVLGDFPVAGAHYYLGQGLHAKGDWEGATASYHDALELAPDYVPAHVGLGFTLCKKKDWDGAIACSKRALELDPKNVEAHHLHAWALENKEDWDGAIDWYKKTLQLEPRYVPAHNDLGFTLTKRQDWDGAISSYQKAIEVDPKYALAHTNLGAALRTKKDLDGAIAEFRKAVELEPQVGAHYNQLGWTLRLRGRLEEAESVCRRAIELDPNVGNHYNSLGMVLWDQKKLEEAAAAFRTAIAKDPKSAWYPYNLGRLLRDMANLEEAIAEFRKAVELDPKLGSPHHQLGWTLRMQGRLNEAEAECRQAIELDPNEGDYYNSLGMVLWSQKNLKGAAATFRAATEKSPKSAPFHENLGRVLRELGDLQRAIDCFDTAIKCEPTYASAHYRLGNAYLDKAEREKAIACYRRAIELSPTLAEAHCNLGLVLQAQGTFWEALELLRRGHELGSQQKDWDNPSAAWVANCRRLLVLDEQLTAILAGKAQLADAEYRATLAEICARPHRRLYARAVQFYREALEAKPGLATAHRYNAACAASLAASGQGKDEKPPDDKQRASFREQTRDWLRAELAERKRVAEADPKARLAVQTFLKHWQKDADLAGVREEASLAGLPSHEQLAWRQLWADVAEVLSSERKTVPATMP